MMYKGEQYKVMDVGLELYRLLVMGFVVYQQYTGWKGGGAWSAGGTAGEEGLGMVKGLSSGGIMT